MTIKLCVFFLLQKIEDGDIYASISQKDGMVLFHDNPDKYDSTSTVERVQKEVFR
jgi:COP9 signalosome complex subunit 3